MALGLKAKIQLKCSIGDCPDVIQPIKFYAESKKGELRFDLPGSDEEVWKFDNEEDKQRVISKIVSTVANTSEIIIAIDVTPDDQINKT